MDGLGARGEGELLLVASSARFLAEPAAARRLAFSAVDGFADAEVRSSARCALRVPLTDRGLEVEAARSACERLLNERRLSGAVVGPGLDAHPALIAWLARRLEVHGNAPEVFALCRDRLRFVERLRRLGVPCPGEGAGVPALSKRVGAGGAQVDFSVPRRGTYRQAYLPGVATSHLFLANRTGIASVGWNTQWQSRHDEARPFCYGGAVNRSALSEALRENTEDYAARLARELSLTGVNGVDYMLCGDELYLLELNPRPSATMQLYEDDVGTLFAAHLEACRSPRSPLPGLPASPPRAHAVLYAPFPLAIPSDFDWPDGACDLPAGALRLERGEPVCTLTAGAASVADALARVQHAVRALLTRFDLAADRPIVNGAGA